MQFAEQKELKANSYNTMIRPLETPLDRPIRLAVLISGGGTTLQNLLDKITVGELNAEVGLVIASRSDCGGLEKAAAAGIPSEVASRKNFADTDSFSETIFKHCTKANVDLVIFGGFLSLVHIPEEYRYRVINIHPALIPAFCGHGYYGHHVHEAVLERGAKVSGCTVHFADNEYDHGPIILQQTVPVLDNDTPEALAERVFQAECLAYPEAIRLFASAKLAIEAGRVRIVS